ncbi:angiopoietin-related protein 4-like [Stigmatopora nigra]
MKTLQIVVLAPALLLNLTAGFAVNRGDQIASWDEVNVVAHGLLQLGQGLKEHVDKTKAQMRDVNGRLKAFNATIAALEKKQREQDEALKARREEESDDIHSRINTLQEKVDEVLTGTPRVESRDNSTMSFIQRVMSAQNRRIDQLSDKIRQQQDKLDKQSLYLQMLQNKVAHRAVKFLRRRDEEMILRGDAASTDDKTGLARDCHDLFVQGQRESGIYTIHAQNLPPFQVYCDMNLEGGWTVIQRRTDGSQNFNQNWEGYKKGFGSLNGEFWLGLENIHIISTQGQYLLQVEVTDWAGQTQSTRYRVNLDGEEKNYALHIVEDSSSGVEGESFLLGTSGLPFSTADRDNDLNADVNCSEVHSGGWWFNSCGSSNLNGKYPKRSNPLRWQPKKMFWTNSKGQRQSLRKTLMKLAPISINQ